MVITRCAPLALAIVCAAGTAPGQTGNERGTLTINLTDVHGLKVGRGTLSIESDRGTEVYSAEVAGQAVVSLPYGHYTATFKGDWYRPASREVAVDKPECFATLAAVFEPEGGNHPGSITIKVEPATSCTADGTLWAKLVGVYSQDVVERRISPHGYALFEPVDSGVYVVIVADGAKVRAASTVVTSGQITSPTLALSACESK